MLEESALDHGCSDLLTDLKIVSRKNLMTSIRKLGLHKPTALPFLISESILPEDPAPEQYTWKTFNDDDTCDVDEEVIFTPSCVVWSRNGIIHRAFRFRASQGIVAQVELTWFPDKSDDEFGSSTGDRTSADPRAKPARPIHQSIRRPHPGTTSQSGCRRALVVILKQQAYVCFLNGPSHIINLPFEVEKVFALPRGLLLQRKIEHSATASSSPTTPAAPHSTFWLGSTGSQTPFRKPNRIPSASKASQHLGHDRQSTKLTNPEHNGAANNADDLPRLFSLDDPLNEFGVVREAPPQSQARAALEALNSREEVIYISPTSEFRNSPVEIDSPLMIAVTLDRRGNSVSVWQAQNLAAGQGADLKNTGIKDSPLVRPRRRTSLGPRVSVGSITPIQRKAHSTRDSVADYGPSATSTSLLHDDISFLSDAIDESNESRLMGALNDSPGGTVQKSVRDRRASSFLARAELPGPDRLSFGDLARPPTATGIAISSTRRGPSLGSVERNRPSTSRLSGRSSMLGNPSTIVPGTFVSSLDDIMVQDMVRDLEEVEIVEAAGSRGERLISGQMRTELVFIKVDSISLDNDIEWSKDLLNHRSKTTKVFTTLGSMRQTDQGQKYHVISIIFATDDSHHIREVLCRVSLNKHSEVSTLSTPQSASAKAIYRARPLRGLTTRQTSQVLDVLPVSDGNFSAVLILHSQDGSTNNLYIAADWLITRDCAGSHITFQQICDAPSNGLVDITDSFHEEAPHGMTRLCRPGLRASFSLIGKDESTVLIRYQLQLQPRRATTLRLLQLCRYLCLDAEWVNMSVYSIWWRACARFAQSKFEADFHATVSTILYLVLACIRPSGTLSRLTAESRAKVVTPTLPGRATLRSAAWRWLAISESNAMSDETFRTCVEVGHELFNNDAAPRRFPGLDSREFLLKLILALHLIREEVNICATMQSLESATCFDIALVICQIGSWLGWEGWDGSSGSHYWLSSQLVQQTNFEPSKYSRLDICSWNSCSFTQELRDVTLFHPTLQPASICSWLEKQFIQLSIEEFQPLAQLQQLFTAQDLKRNSSDNDDYHTFIAMFVPRLAAVTSLVRALHAKAVNSAVVVEAMATYNITRGMLDSLSEPIAAWLNNHITNSNTIPFTTWSERASDLVGRKDLGEGQVDRNEAHVSHVSTRQRERALN